MPAPVHSRETLFLTASFSWCMKDFLLKLGEPDTPSKRRWYWTRVRRLGIPTDHWDRSPKRFYSDALLAQAAKESISYAGVLRLLGVPNTGGQHSHLARRIRAAGIDTSHFLGQAHQRGTTQPRRDPAQVLVVLPAGSARPKRGTLFNALKKVGMAYECAICGCGPEWRGEELTLAIDHINGDWLDNRRENLRFLCPNCHAQTSSWCRIPSARRN
jgi:hypothetical protein